MIGLSGAHRVGKTTLATLFAKSANIIQIKTTASSVFEQLGLDPKEVKSFDLRMIVQNAILDEFERQYAGANGQVFIADRTPLDMLAYTLADIQGKTVEGDMLVAFESYVRRCIRTTNKFFASIVVVQPGIPIVEENGKASANAAYMEHLNSLILGLTVDERVRAKHFYLPRHMTDLDERVKALVWAFGQTMQRAATELESHILTGAHVH